MCVSPSTFTISISANLNLHNRQYLQFLSLCIIAPHLLNIRHPEHIKLLAVRCITAVHLTTQLNVQGWLWGLLFCSICYQLF